MSRILKNGSHVNDYEIVRRLGSGAMAISYEARSPSGERVFFKQYKSPSVTVEWYDAYVRYQGKIKHSIESTNAHRFCYKFIDFFESNVGSSRGYFQVFEFVEKGSDLGKILEQIGSDPGSVSWDQRLIWARVMMAGVAALHEAGVVHCDLKPANIQLIRDVDIRAGYVLKLIDMDFSILADSRAPWDGIQGYVGSPNYFSPEHLTSPPPRPASDVFTCGLILYELLAGRHPYTSEDEEEYRREVLGYRAPQPNLVASMPTAEADDRLRSTLHACLSPNPAERPTAVELRDALRTSSSRFGPHPPRPRPPAPSPAPEPRPEPSPTPAPQPRPADTALRLVAETGKELSVTIRTEIGKYLLRQLGDEAKFYATLQFTLGRGDDGQWFVTPSGTATNETLLNGHAISSRTILSEGDVLAVGREAKGISKLPLTVRFGS